MDSHEISEWIVMEDIERWKTIVEEKRIKELDDNAKSDLLVNTLFGGMKVKNG